MYKNRFVKIQLSLLILIFTISVIFIFFPKVGVIFEKNERDFVENFTPEKMNYSIPNSDLLKPLKNGGVLLFFETWCPSCMIELSGVNYVASQKIPTIAIYSDSNIETIERLKKDVGYKDIIFQYDENEYLGKHFEINSIPATFIVNSDNSVIYKISGSRVFFRDSIVKFIKKL